jgi:hypothetical protein
MSSEVMIFSTEILRAEASPNGHRFSMSPDLPSMPLVC